MMVASLRAGTALLGALEATLTESRQPMRGELENLVGRIRLGEDPRAAVKELAMRVPLESFRLFSYCLLVHWETGGSLAVSLRTVASTVRDRIEVARRIAAQAVESPGLGGRRDGHHLRSGAAHVSQQPVDLQKAALQPDRLLYRLRPDVHARPGNRMDLADEPYPLLSAYESGPHRACDRGGLVVRAPARRRRCAQALHEAGGRLGGGPPVRRTRRRERGRTSGKLALARRLPRAFRAAMFHRRRR